MTCGLSSACYVSFILFFMLSSSYRHLVCRHHIVVFDLSSTYYDMMFFVVLLQHVICVRAIQISKTDLINIKLWSSVC